MPTTLNCPNCGQAVTVEAAQGTQAMCAVCNSVVNVPPAGQQPSVEPAVVGYAAPPAGRQTGMALTSMILGIIGIVLICVYIGPLIGIVALILGIIALRRTKRQPDLYGGRGYAIAGIATGGVSVALLLIIVPLLISIMLPALSRARELAKRSVCMANLRGVGQGLFIYANDNQDWFPPHLQTLVDEGHSSPQSLLCPSSGTVAGQGPDYTYIPGLHRNVDFRWVIAFEDPANHGGQGGCLLFADGHVEFLKEPRFSAELQRVRGEIDASRFAQHPWYRAFTWP